MSDRDRPRLHVCVTCRGGAATDQAPTAGQRLFDAVAELLPPAGAPLSLHSVTCLWNCSSGCSAAIGMHGKWSFLLGRLSPSAAPDLLAYAAAYAASASGTVLASHRPPSLRDAVIGRVPGPGAVA